MSKFNVKTGFSKLKAKATKTKVQEVQDDAQEVKSAFIKGLDERNKKFQQDTDMEFFIAIAFQNREQKEAFLKAKGWDKLGDKYFAGIDIAPIEGVKLAVDKNMRKAFKFSPSLKTL
jgi:hypothetical protein